MAYGRRRQNRFHESLRQSELNAQTGETVSPAMLVVSDMSMFLTPHGALPPLIEHTTMLKATLNTLSCARV